MTVSKSFFATLRMTLLGIFRHPKWDAPQPYQVSIFRLEDTHVVR